MMLSQSYCIYATGMYISTNAECDLARRVSRALNQNQRPGLAQELDMELPIFEELGVGYCTLISCYMRSSALGRVWLVDCVAPGSCLTPKRAIRKMK